MSRTIPKAKWMTIHVASGILPRFGPFKFVGGRSLVFFWPAVRNQSGGPAGLRDLFPAPAPNKMPEPDWCHKVSTDLVR